MTYIPGGATKTGQDAANALATSGNASLSSVDSKLTTANLTTLDIRELLQVMILELRAMRAVLVTLATEDGTAKPADFAPSAYQDIFSDEVSAS